MFLQFTALLRCPYPVIFFCLYSEDYLQLQTALTSNREGIVLVDNRVLGIVLKRKRTVHIIPQHMSIRHEFFSSLFEFCWRKLCQSAPVDYIYGLVDNVEPVVTGKARRYLNIQQCFAACIYNTYCSVHTLQRAAPYLGILFHNAAFCGIRM